MSLFVNQPSCFAISIFVRMLCLCDIETALLACVQHFFFFIPNAIELEVNNRPRFPYRILLCKLVSAWNHLISLIVEYNTEWVSELIYCYFTIPSKDVFLDLLSAHDLDDIARILQEFFSYFCIILFLNSLNELFRSILNYVYLKCIFSSSECDF